MQELFSIKPVQAPKKQRSTCPDFWTGKKFVEFKGLAGFQGAKIGTCPRVHLLSRYRYTDRVVVLCLRSPASGGCALLWGAFGRPPTRLGRGASSAPPSPRCARENLKAGSSHE